MNDVATWIAVVGAGGGASVITFITFWMALGSRIASAEGRAKAAEEKAKSAELLASASIAKVEMAMRDVFKDSIETAAKIAGLQAISDATTRSLTQAESRLARSVEDLGEKMDHLADTIIKTLGELIARPSSKS